MKKLLLTILTILICVEINGLYAMQEPKLTDNKTQQAQAILVQGTNLNAQSESGHVPLYDAVKANAYEAIPVLIEAGAILDTTILNKAKCVCTHLHTRKLLATTVCPR